MTWNLLQANNSNFQKSCAPKRILTLQLPKFLAANLQFFFFSNFLVGTIACQDMFKEIEKLPIIGLFIISKIH